MVIKKPRKDLKVPRPQPWPIPFFAHRGGTPKREEENTLAAFEKAVEMKSPGIELDIHLVKGKLKVAHYKRDAIRKNIVTLEEALECINRKSIELKQKKPIINIDLKSKGTGKKVAALIKRYVTRKKWKYTDFIITAFIKKNIKGVRDKYIELKKLRKENRKIPIGIIGRKNILEPHLPFIHELNACSLHTKWKPDKFTIEFVNDAHQYGLTVYPWTVNTYEQMIDIHTKGADGVITDCIDIARKVWYKKQK